MPGLLDLFTGGGDPVQQQGLLAAAAGILNASGPSLMPRSFGQVLGAGLQGYQQSQNLAQDQALSALKLKALRGELDDKEKARQDALAAQDWFRKYNMGGQTDATAPARAVLGNDMAPTITNAEKLEGTWGGPTPPAAAAGGSPDLFSQRIAQAQAMRASGNPLLMAQADKLEEAALKFRPKYDTKPETGVDANGKTFSYVLGEDGSIKRLDGILPRDKLENVNGVWTNPYAQQPGAIAPQDPNKPFMIGADGKPVANAAYQDFEISKSRAGAPSVKVENKAGESIAAQVGPMLKDSATAAVGALGQIDAADRVLGAVKAGKIYAGPWASNRLSVAQLGQTLGVGGADDAARIANTRQVVRGLAELTLQGRKTMQGQGQITDKESDLAQKAMSGDIDSLTGPELVQIANASKRAAQYVVSTHQSKVAKARANPATAGIADYFDTPAIPAEQGIPSAPTAGGKTITLADIAETARKSGRSTKDVTAAARAAGYTITGGQ